MARASATKTSNEQMTVTRGVRERLGIGAGERLAAVIDNGDVVVRPAKGDIRLLRGLLAASPSKKRRVRIADMEAAILGSHARRG